MREWISVKDQKPPKDRDILVSDETGEYMYVVSWDDDHSYYTHTRNCRVCVGRCYPQDISYWMFLPKAPQ